MRTNPTRDRAITGIVLATLVVATFVIIACSNTEEVTAPAMVETDATPGTGLVSAEGNAVFFDENGNKTVVEMADGNQWTPEEELKWQFEIQKNGLDVREVDPQQLKQHLQQLHEEGDVSFSDDGKHAVFVEEDGQKVLVEFEGEWMSKQELHEELQNEKDD